MTTHINFQLGILIVAGIMYIATLSIVGYFMSSRKNRMEWPPIISNCPDYWADMDGTGAKCVNTHKLGTCNVSTDQPMNFTTQSYTGSNGTCSKYTWAKNCGVTWDGITTTDTSPCA